MGASDRTRDHHVGGSHSLFRALGEPSRLRILHVLEDGEKSVSEIVGLLDSSQPNISKHLKALCLEGIVARRREGLNIRYSISDPVVLKICDLISQGARSRKAKA